MRTSVAVAVAGLLSVANAGHSHNHALFHNKRQQNLTDQCSTVWSTWYGEPTMVPLPPPPSTSSSATSTSSTSSVVVHSTSATPSPSASPVPQAPPPASGSGVDFFGHALGSSGMNGITYTPYEGYSAATSSCKSASQMAADVQQIHSQGFNRLRLYATDCDQLSAVGPAAEALGMRLIIGIFPRSPSTADSDFASQLSSIQSYFKSNGGSNIDALLVANEPMIGGHATVNQVASYLQQAKAAFPNLVVSVALTHPELIEYGSQLCPLMPVVAAQVHPFFASSYVAPGNSGDYVESEMGLMSALCGNIPVFVSETGYPSGGGTFNSQIAGVSEQQTAVGSLRAASKANHMTVFSSSVDDWKSAPGVMAYETMFNCLDLF